MKIFIGVFALLFAVLFCTPASADAITCKIVGISDGDTVTALCQGNQQLKIRLAQIDAPEKAQPFGEASKKSLSDLCFGKNAVINTSGQDKYNRTIGQVTCDGTDANAEQVRRGMAWAYRQYLTDASIADLEAGAKAKQIGLWADKNPIPPWEFRHGTKDAPAPKSAATQQCEGKTKCREMRNCAEAKFYLNECGVSRLDRDHDGVPCESICK